MTGSNVKTLQENWHQAVRDHEQVAREARRRGLSQQEFQEIGKAYLLRVDAAYSRLKTAEAATGRC
jgi:hypothetical protein